jgi:hypothetical protein
VNFFKGEKPQPRKPKSVLGATIEAVTVLARRVIALEQRPVPRNGIDGIQGIPGEPGAPGPQGEIGHTGPQGLAGERGEMGPQGIAGEAGPQGEAGPAGTDGRDGAPGAQGERGPAGEMGPMGPQGEAGPRGERGEAGVSMVGAHQDNGNLIVTLSNGQTDNIGSFKGDKGERGEKGEPADLIPFAEMMAQLHAVIDDARKVRGEHALEKVITGLDATIKSMNTPKEIVFDAKGKPVGIKSAKPKK